MYLHLIHRGGKKFYESVSGRLRKLLALGDKRAGVGILIPKYVSDESHRT